MARWARTRKVSAAQARGYLTKAEDYLAAALGKRAAGQDHDRASVILKEAGRDGAELDKDLCRLVPMKTKTDYDPDEISLSAASKAVGRARSCVAVAR